MKKIELIKLLGDGVIKISYVNEDGIKSVTTSRGRNAQIIMTLGQALQKESFINPKY